MIADKAAEYEENTVIMKRKPGQMKCHFIIP
jgi:hypothetical protein